MKAPEFKEIMDNYNAKKAEWLTKYNTEQGFDEWFAKQVMRGNNETTNNNVQLL